MEAWDVGTRFDTELIQTNRNGIKIMIYYRISIKIITDERKKN